MHATGFENQAERSHVICVNSSIDLLEMICALLDDEGYRTTALRLSSHPADEIASLGPDALVIDLVPGNADSWELLEWIHANHVTSSIPRIVISTDPKALESLQQQPERFGHTRVMTKPFDVYELCSILHDLLQVSADEGA